MSASLVASQRRLRQGKLGYCAAVVLTVQASLGGDKDSNWLGLNESEEEDWLPSIHFLLQQAPPSLIMTTLHPIKCVWAMMGISHWEVLAPFAKAVIMGRYEGPRSTRGRCHQTGDNNRAFSGLPLQFSHIDNRIRGTSAFCASVCMFLGFCLMHNKCFYNNGSRTWKQLAVMKRNHLQCWLKDNSAPWCFFPQFFFIESFIREKKTTHKTQVKS